jgi:hypothetical protein
MIDPVKESINWASQRNLRITKILKNEKSKAPSSANNANSQLIVRSGGEAPTAEAEVVDEVAPEVGARGATIPIRSGSEPSLTIKT